MCSTTMFGTFSWLGSSQSRIPGVAPLAPSPVPNALTGRMVDEASEEEIKEMIEAFGSAARRAVEAGFDGVHIHAANGYLISEFASPIANRRSDGWGGSAADRDQFPLAVVRSIREQVPADFPVTMKIGFADAPENGLGVDESAERVGKLVEAGLDRPRRDRGIGRGHGATHQFLRKLLGGRPKARDG